MKPNQMPDQIGPYRIEQEIGRGGMSVVYRALDTRSESRIALKVLHNQFAHDPAFLHRFVRESKSAAQLNHPNIVRFFEAGQSGNYHYIAMALIPGGTLSAALRYLDSPLPVERTVAIIQDVASGLDHAHKLSFLHRDIKLSNVLLTGELTAPDSRALLADFGVAKQIANDYTVVTQAGYAVGTPTFMSPEQARGDANIDHRSDIYSLGVVAYVMFTGQLPFQADSQPVLLHKIVYEPPQMPEEVNPNILPGIAYVLKRVLTKEPPMRYRSAGEFAAALQEGITWVPTAPDYASTPSAPVVTVSPPSTPQRRTRTSYLLIGVLAVIVIALALLLPSAITRLGLLGPPTRQGISAPIVLRSFTSRDGQFTLNVPNNWSKSESDNAVVFDAPDFFARLFIQRLDTPDSQDSSDVLLARFKRSPETPFRNLVLTQQREHQADGKMITEQALTGTWLGEQVAVRLMAIEETETDHTDHTYLIGTAVEVNHESTLNELVDAIFNSFKVSSPNESVAAVPTASSTPTAAAPMPTLRPTSTPFLTRTATATPAETSAAPSAEAPTGASIETSSPGESRALRVTAAKTFTPTNTLTRMPTTTMSPTATPTSTSAPTVIDTATATVTGTPTKTVTPRPTQTASPTSTPQVDLTATVQSEIGATFTAIAVSRISTPPATDTGTPTAAPTTTPTMVPTTTPSQTATFTSAPTASATPLPSLTPSATPSSTQTRRATQTATETGTVTHTPTPNPTDTPQPDRAATFQAAVNATLTAIALVAPPTATATHTPTPTFTFTPTNTSRPTHTSTTTPSPTHTPRPTQTPTRVPIATATPLPRPTATRAVPTATVATPTAKPAAPTVPPGASVRLLSPLDSLLKGQHVFRWEANIVLGANQYFELIFWEVGQDPFTNGFGPVGAKLENAVTVNLDKTADILPSLLISGREYEWGVLLVELNPYKRLQFLGSSHRFRFERSGGGGGGAPPPTATPR